MFHLISLVFLFDSNTNLTDQNENVPVPQHGTPGTVRKRANSLTLSVAEFIYSNNYSDSGTQTELMIHDSLMENHHKR